MADERIEFSLAIISSVITNIAIAALGKPGTKRTTPSDFLPRWDSVEESRSGEKQPKKQSVEEMKNILQSIAAVYGKPKKKKEVD